jgi:hypothetical protein
VGQARRVVRQPAQASTPRGIGSQNENSRYNSVPMSAVSAIADVTAAYGAHLHVDATTFLALGRAGLGALTDRCCAAAEDAAGQIERRPGLRLLSRPELSTVLFRPVAADRLGDRAGDATDRRRARGWDPPLAAGQRRGGPWPGHRPRWSRVALAPSRSDAGGVLSKRGGREKDWQRGGLDRTHVDRMTRPRLLS